MNLKRHLELKKYIEPLLDDSIVDVFLFGSYVKNKSNPSDIDICIVFKDKIGLNKVHLFEETLSQNNINSHISFLTVSQFFTKMHALSRTQMFEGISLINGESMAERYGLKSLTMYSYNLNSLSSSDKVRFVYFIRGRNKKKGIIAQLNGKFLSKSCFVVPVQYDAEILQALEQWNIEFTRQKIFQQK